MRRILIKVWQGELSPKQALKELEKMGFKFAAGKEKRGLEVLTALKKKEVNVNEAEEEIALLECVGCQREKDLCQI
ncbi:MAG: hypothetical protein Q8R39_00385 [bacterium]|nr:hypothetical protein [bacterium]